MLKGLNEFCKQANKGAREKGFWDSYYKVCKALPNNDKDGEMCLIKEVGNAFLTQKIALIQSELSEAVEALRKEKCGLEEKDTFEDELADTFIRLADLCGELDIDIEKQIEWKMNYNSSRDRLHGKSF